MYEAQSVHNPTALLKLQHSCKFAPGLPDGVFSYQKCLYILVVTEMENVGRYIGIFFGHLVFYSAI
jgi:hypothetical protein